MNFMQAKTEIDGLNMKMDDLINKSASVVADALIDRAKKGNINKQSTEKDIENLISSFSPEYQTAIIIKALTLLAMNGKFGPSSHKNNDDDFSSMLNRSRGDIFKSRR